MVYYITFLVIYIHMNSVCVSIKETMTDLIMLRNYLMVLSCTNYQCPNDIEDG